MHNFLEFKAVSYRTEVKQKYIWEHHKYCKFGFQWIIILNSTMNIIKYAFFFSKIFPNIESVANGDTAVCEDM